MRELSEKELQRRHKQMQAIMDKLNNCRRNNDAEIIKKAKKSKRA